MVELRGKRASANQKHYPVLGSDASLVWNFCARFSDAISRGNRWWRRECHQFSQAKDSDNPQELRQYRQMGYFIEKKQTAPLLPPVHSKLGCWLSPTVLSSNTSTKLHGGGRGEKATFFSFEVVEMSEARDR